MTAANTGEMGDQMARNSILVYVDAFVGDTFATGRIDFEIKTPSPKTPRAPT